MEWGAGRGYHGFMEKKLDGFKVAILVTGGFEQSELVEPKKALEAAGATISIVSPVIDAVQSVRHDSAGRKFPVDVQLDHAEANDFDALLLPGGVANADRLRIMPRAVAFVKKFVDTGKPIAAICHGPWTLIEAGAVRGRRLTSWPSLKTDLTNAGARWTDAEVVVDAGLVTSRKTDDIPAFVARMIEEFAESRHARSGGAVRGARR
jgi:protease I